MKAVGYWQKGLAISDPQALLDIELPEPEMPTGRDLLVSRLVSPFREF